MPVNLQGIGWEGLTFGPIKIEYGTKGTTTHFTVQCLEIGPLVSYYNYVVQFGATGTFLGTDVGVDGTTSAEVKILEVSVPGLVNGLSNYLSELYFDSWELLTNETQDSIFADPLIVGSSAGWMNINDKDVLSTMVSRGDSLTQALADADTDVPANAPHTTPMDARSLQLITEILKGQTQYQTPAYVLRHTSYCSPGALYNISVIHDQSIYTPAQLLTEVGSGWTYNLPPRLYSKISQIPVQYAPASEATYYRWGWLKTISRETQMENFMIEISTEFACGLWSNLRYALR